MSWKLCLLGHPVGHSRSPRMITAAFTSLGLDAQYEARDVSLESLTATLDALAADGYRGANVTVPHKVGVAAWLGPSRLSEDAAQLGAVNTLVRVGNAWRGHNTDAPGLAQVLADEGLALDGRSAVVLGGGGAARAACRSLAMRGVRRVTVLVRDVARAEASFARRSIAETALSVEALGGAAARDAFTNAAVIVQCTNAGMTGGPAADPKLAEGFLCAAASTACVDLVYAPRETEWLRAARRAGLRVVEDAGARMLVAQGAISVALWTGHEPDRSAMSAAAF